MLSYNATQAKIQELYKEPWHNDDLSRYENKAKMKEHAVAIWGYEDFITEMTIIGMAKAIEDTFEDINELNGQKIDIWAKQFVFSVRNLEEARVIRNLNNVVKHRRGRIDGNHEPAGKYLVSKGFPANSEVKELKLDLMDYLLKVYIFLRDLVFVFIGGPEAKLLPQNVEELIKDFVPQSLHKAV